MSEWTAPLQVGIVVAVGATLAFIWYLDGREDWRAHLERRFIYGVPWGTVLSVVGVMAVYLFVQSGFSHWSDPVIHPFRSWAYTYPLGILAASFTHAGPNHLLGNLMATVVLSPIAEYAWGHYPPGTGTDRDETGSEYTYPPPAGQSGDGSHGNAGPAGSAASRGWLETPWIRALVLYPLAVIVVSLLTSVFALGWSLGFSGTVFVFLGFALIRYPLTTVGSMVAFSGVSVVMRALREPILVETTDPGAPSPPSWAGINVQAHLLGFLIGVLLAIWLFSARDYRFKRERIAVATILVLLARGIWGIALGGDDVYRLYQGVGVIFVIGLSSMIIAIFATSEKPLLRHAPGLRGRSVATGLAIGWLALGAIIGGGLLAAYGTGQGVIAGVAVLIVLWSVPSLPTLLPDWLVSSPVTYRHVTIGLVLFLTLLIMAISVPFNLPGMADEPVPEGESVTIQDYTITYAENVTHGRIDTNESGVIVVSERREIWSTVVDTNQLAHRGNETVVVGGVGWRETVTVNRTGWDVAGNESAYVVDLVYDGEVSRTFTSDPVEAQSRVANQTIAVAPGTDSFRLNVTRDDQPVGDVAIPAVNESASVADLRFTTEEEDDTKSVFAEQDGTRVLIAEWETYD